MHEILTMSRPFIILAIVIVVLGLAAGAYFYFFTGTAGVTTAPGTTGGLPAAGQEPAPTSPATTVGGGGETTPPGAPAPVTARLVKISAGPVVPGMMVVRRAGTASSTPETIVSYLERQSGNVYTYDSLTKTTTRTSNKTIPGIVSASWLPNGAAAFVRYLSANDAATINTYSLPSSGANGFFLAQNLADVSVSSTSVLTLTSGVNGSVASLARTDGARATQAFTTPLSSLRVSFAGKSQYLAFTKPAATLPGDAFLVDSAGRFSRVAGPENGLVARASPSGKWVLVSYTQGSALLMQLVNAATGEKIQLPIATIADKCVWAANDSSVYCGIPVNAPAAAYPDDWYQGAVHFSDRIWRIDVTSRYAQLVLDFNKEADAPLDALAPALDQAGTTLVFINKNDGSLWAYSL